MYTYIHIYIQKLVHIYIYTYNFAIDPTTAEPVSGACFRWLMHTHLYDPHSLVSLKSDH